MGADMAALHDDAVTHVRALLDVHLAEDHAAVCAAIQMAAVSQHTVRSLPVLAEQRRHRVADLRVDRHLAAEKAPADILLQKRHGVVVILQNALVEQRHVVERVDVDLQTALQIVLENEVPLKMILSVRHHVADHRDELFALHDEHAHADQILLRRTVARGQIDQISVLVELHRQLLRLDAVTLSGLGDDRDVAAGLDMLFQHLEEIDRTEHRRVCQHHIIAVVALKHRQRCLERLELSAVRAGVAGGVGRQKAHAVAELEIPFVTVSEMIHQGLIVIFRDNADVADAGVRHVGKDEVDLTVASAEGDGGGGALAGQLAHVVVVDVGENNAHHIHRRILPFSALRRSSRPQ